jgi:hypothetical protein
VQRRISDLIAQILVDIVHANVSRHDRKEVVDER